MCDRITYCDIVECCEDCPKYGDDCDGEKRNDDLISRADAIEAVRFDTFNTLNADERELAINRIPSAEPSIKAIKRQIDEHWYLDPPSAERGDAEVNEVKSPYMQQSPNGADLISRADAIEAVKDAYEMDEFYKVISEDIINVLSALPSAEPSLKAIKRQIDEHWYLDTPSAEAEQVTGKLKKTCDSLLTGDSAECKESGSKLDLISRELAMERIANDNVVGGMERINEYNNSTEWNEYLDGISDAITTIFCDVPSADITETETCQKCQDVTDTILNRQGEEIKRLKASAEAEQGEWILVKGSNGKYYHKCSKCLHTQEITGVKNYCAVCGTRMKRGEDE